MESTLIGACESAYSCVYYNTIVWSTPTTPLPTENRPRAIFERLFGDGSTAAQRIARKEEDRSILDSITHDVAALRKVIGPSDRVRLNDYLEEVREIERRIQMVRKAAANLPEGSWV